MGANREQRKIRASGWHSLASSGNQLALCCTASAGDSCPNRLGILMESYPMFWHKARFGGIGKQREELLASHNPPSPLENMDLNPIVVSGSPHSSPSRCVVPPNPASAFSSGRSLSINPDLNLPSALTRPSVSAKILSGPSALVMLWPASRSRNNMEAEKEGFLELR